MMRVWNRFALLFAAALAACSADVEPGVQSRTGQLPPGCDAPADTSTGSAAASGNAGAGATSSTPPTTSSAGDAAAPSDYRPLTIPPNAIVYYVDAIAGDDQNDGRTEDHAWKTLDRVSQADLAPGAFVLFRRGQTFSGGVTPKTSGAPDSPITFGSYGSGARPVLDGAFGAYSAFELSGRQHVVVRDLDLTNYNGPAVHVNDVVDVLVYDVVISHTGADQDMSGIHGNNASHVTADHVTMTDITGDAFGVWGGDHLKVLNSAISRVSGASADDIHIAWTDDIEIRHNWLDLTNSNSGKGNMCICEDEHAVIADNVLIGGNYAVGAMGNHYLVEGNWAEDNRGADWSYTFAWGGQAGVPIDYYDYVARNNVIVRGGIAFAVFSNSGDGRKHGYESTGNVIIDSNVAMGTWGVEIENGSFHDNSLFNTPEGLGIASANNVSVGSPPAVVRPSPAGRGAF